MRARHLARIIASAGGCIFVYVLLAIALHPSERALDYHFGSERGLVTAASVVLLAAASAFALSALAVLVRSSAVPIWPWRYWRQASLSWRLMRSPAFTSGSGG